MLGSAADAEDVLQESWLRWAGVDRSQVREPRSYLIRVVTRQALNRLRTLSRSREDYVGEWLPEPLLTSPDVAEDVELAESVSIAMLTVLETLGPVERAVFVLREVLVLAHASRRAFASTTAWLNGTPGGLIEVDGEPAAVSLVVEDGLVTRVYLVRNPRKLTRLTEAAHLTR
jgi:Sigma-70 region 2